MIHGLCDGMHDVKDILGHGLWTFVTPPKFDTAEDSTSFRSATGIGIQHKTI